MSDLEAIGVSAGGIKCDACDYRDETVTVESYPEWLNRPCPKCGANLLTQGDFDAVTAILANIRWFNTIAGPVADEADAATPVTIEFDGSGVPIFKVGERST